MEVAYAMTKCLMTYNITKTVVYLWGMFLSDKDIALSLAAAMLALEAWTFMDILYNVSKRTSASALASPAPLPPRILQFCLVVVGTISLYFPDLVCAFLSKVANKSDACIGI
jgi:hypothetical protein